MTKIADGPTAGTDWCHFDPLPPDLPRDAIAPGGVVLCYAGTHELHPDAQRAAESAKAILARFKGTP